MNKRLNTLIEVIEAHNLDFILIYSDEFDHRYEYWLNSTRPLYFHYLCLDKNANLFYLEHSYLIDDLKKKIQPEIRVLPINEGSIHKDIKKIIGSNKNVGILGNVPFDHLKDIYQDCRIYFLNETINPFLTYKSKEDISIISTIAQEITQIAQEIPNLIENSSNLIQLADLIKKEIFSKSADGLSFPISIANDTFLQQSTVKIPDEEPINQNNYALCVDMGLKKYGFYTDITRMYFSPKHFLEDFYERLKKAHYKVIEQVKAGISLREIVDLYYKELERVNLPNRLEVQDLGHSIGFGLHEEPFICIPKTEEFTLNPNTVITLEPEIILDNEYRIRIEDMILITEEKARVLTEF